jgi:hypothetical protein
MGVSSSPREFAAKLDKFGRDLNNVRVPLNATALHVKRVMETSAATSGALGSKPKGKRKVVGVRYDLKGDGPTMQAVVGYTGPAHLVNNPTRPHRIEPRRPRGRATRRRRGSTALVINGAVRAYANHPGTRGKGFFQKAAAVAARTAPRVYAQKQLTEPLRRNF